MPVETDTELRQILTLDPIAVIGCSTTAGKPAHDVPKYMIDHGYEIIPVNPFADEIFGREAYDSITDVPERVPLVDVFRPSDEIPEIVDEVLERDGVEALWMQLGISHDEAATRAESAGLRVVQDRCIKVEHQRLIE
ncbi:CoA-binding protein [Halovenus marina]|uniref:CoA-binding protein n=1 Tax=Halovenus marina TaxID=3396621 RepID=UPI003F56FD32